MKWNAVITLVLAFSLPSSLFAEEPTDFTRVPVPTGLLEPGTKTAVAALVCFLEGPAVDRAGNLFFSDISSNRILKMSPAGDVSVFRADSGRTNGNAFDAEGRLVSCEGAALGPGGRRRVVRTDMKTGQVTVLTDRYEGKRYNSPNDLCVDAAGRIWFTDPIYGQRNDLEMTIEGVYRIDPDGNVTRALARPVIQKPNGITVSPDSKTLYVVDANDAPGGNRKIWGFDISATGDAVNRHQIYDFQQARGADGIRVDINGNIWAAAGIRTPRRPGETTEMPQGIYVISPQGKLLGRIPIPEDFVTNLCFGGPNHKMLYVTAGTSIYQVPVSVPGYVLGGHSRP